MAIFRLSVGSRFVAGNQHAVDQHVSERQRCCFSRYRVFCRCGAVLRPPGQRSSSGPQSIFIKRLLGFMPPTIRIHFGFGKLSQSRLRRIEALNANLWWMSPPCQPYTLRGNRRDVADPRAQSLLRMIDLIEVCRTRVLVARERLRLREIDGLGASLSALGPMWLPLANDRAMSDCDGLAKQKTTFLLNCPVLVPKSFHGENCRSTLFS